LFWTGKTRNIWRENEAFKNLHICTMFSKQLFSPKSQPKPHDFAIFGSLQLVEHTNKVFFLTNKWQGISTRCQSWSMTNQPLMATYIGRQICYVFGDWWFEFTFFFSTPRANKWVWGVQIGSTLTSKTSIQLFRRSCMQHVPISKILGWSFLRCVPYIFSFYGLGEVLVW